MLDSGRVDLTNKVTSATNTRDSGAKYFILNGTNGPDELIKLDAKTQISLYGGNGNDTLITGVGNDYIDDNGGWVGQNNDSINSGDGNDTIYGQVDDDIIIAWGSEADGNDLAVGGGGNDYIEGGAGNDHLYGHESGSPVWINGGAFFSDTLDGGAGQDVLYGSAGGDLLIGGSEAEGADKSDTIYGNDGNDTIFGGSGNDTVHAGVGDDLANGGLGADTIAGGDGNDSLNGQGLSDYLFGNAGDDYLNGGFGYDRLNGGTGADQFYHLGNVNHGSDWIQDYTAADGDVLVWGGGAAAESDFLVQRANTASAGSADVDEVFITHVPSGLLAWALVDGDAQTALNVRVGDATFDLLA
ncbi:calcium-binding protein [Pseudoprimorskyibacter insulae]|uniref:calcium-binding protein n=1 Tax=Pseudoprimorskyibacter insulae TaxID=1695997 RepID=UPI002481F370|nr:calcium-binding protein [Pseudoprimorskyibacter insulae]